MLSSTSGGGRQRARATATSTSTSSDSVERDDASGDELLGIADRLGNRAVFKRLGFLAERLPGRQQLAAACRERLSRAPQNSIRWCRARERGARIGLLVLGAG
jgi:hypothetical protein